MRLLYKACHGHTHARTHPDVTVQTCWDSDRLDLGRVGITPHPSRLCTEVAKRPEIIKWADGRASFGVVPKFVLEEWGNRVGEEAVVKKKRKLWQELAVVRREHELHERIWDVYHSTNIRMFDCRMKAFRKWFESNQWSQSISKMTAKLWNRASQYRQAFQHDGCYRTSNQVDRLMNRMTRLMYSGRGLHGNHTASECRLRGWALMVNFVPYAHRSHVNREHRCPAHQLSNKCYSNNWLENLLVSASMNGKPWAQKALESASNKCLR